MSERPGSGKRVQARNGRRRMLEFFGKKGPGAHFPRSFSNSTYALLSEIRAWPLFQRPGPFLIGAFPACGAGWTANGGASCQRSTWRLVWPARSVWPWAATSSVSSVTEQSPATSPTPRRKAPIWLRARRRQPPAPASTKAPRWHRHGIAPTHSAPVCHQGFGRRPQRGRGVESPPGISFSSLPESYRELDDQIPCW